MTTTMIDILFFGIFIGVILGLFLGTSITLYRIQKYERHKYGRP
jgi:hypothetical protein